MKANKRTRVGGLGIDPRVAEWRQGAVTNVAALNRKQRQDRARVRIKIDLAAEVKQALVQRAAEIDTSQSQLAAFLLAWALRELASDEALQQAIEGSKWTARSLHFRWNLEIPEEILRTLT